MQMTLNPGRQSDTSHTPKTIAGIEKIPCKIFITKREGELEKAELLVRGPINSTAEKLTNNAQIAINIIISWIKYLPLNLTHILTKIKPVQKVCIIRLISAKLNPTCRKREENYGCNCPQNSCEDNKDCDFSLRWVNLHKLSCFISPCYNR